MHGLFIELISYNGKKGREDRLRVVAGEPSSSSATSSRMLRLILSGCQGRRPRRLKPRFYPGAISARVELVPFPACALDPRLPAEFSCGNGLRQSGVFSFFKLSRLTPWLLCASLRNWSLLIAARPNELHARSLRALEKTRAFGMTPFPNTPSEA